VVLLAGLMLSSLALAQSSRTNDAAPAATGKSATPRDAK